jgi:hypothetical protein
MNLPILFLPSGAFMYQTGFAGRRLLLIARKKMLQVDSFQLDDGSRTTCSI